MRLTKKEFRDLINEVAEEMKDLEEDRESRRERRSDRQDARKARREFRKEVETDVDVARDALDDLDLDDFPEEADAPEDKFLVPRNRVLAAIEEAGHDNPEETLRKELVRSETHRWREIGNNIAVTIPRMMALNIEPENLASEALAESAKMTSGGLRQMILREMRGLNEQADWRQSTEYHPSQMSLDREWEAAQAEQLEKRAEAFEYFRTFTIPLIRGPIHTEAEAMELAMEKFPDIPKQGEDPGPMARSGVNVPTLDRVPMQEMRSAGTHAGALEMMQADPDETVMFEPGEEVPSADAIADAVEGIQDQGLLTKIWSMIKSATKPINPEDAFEYARQQRKNPTGVNKWLGGGAADAVLDDLGTLSEGYEPGGYRYEGDRRLNDVSIGTGRWNLLAGIDKK